MYYDPRQELNCQHMTKNESLDTLSLWGKSIDYRKEQIDDASAEFEGQWRLLYE